MTRRLEGRIALVTGGARGQGASHGRVFAEEGAKVVLGDVLDDLGRETVGAMRRDGFEATYVHLDVTSSKDWLEVVSFVENDLGPLSILVNNAGIISAKGAVEESEEMWGKVVSVNQTGVFLGMKHVVPAMRRAGGGAIVNVSSTLGIVGAEEYIAYQATKGAVRQMTKSAALSYVADGIRVNSVCPGFIDTAMTVALGSEIYEHDVGATPMGRAGECREISRGVLYLASNESSYVTGTELVIDGGYCAQ